MAAVAAFVLIAAVTGLVVVALRYRAEKRENRRVRAIFSRYVAPPIVEELLRRKDPRLYTGREMQASILVCRIWNFAGFAEELSAEETLRYLNEFFALAGTSIQKHRGMIDKFLADGIIGVFGVPLEDAYAAEHAVNAALDIVRLVDAMDQRWRTQGRRSFQVGIGISSGQVIAGDAGFHERREFTVVGPETLFAASLQEATEALPAFIIASAGTCQPIRHQFSLMRLTALTLPGIKRVIDGYVVLGQINEPESLRLPSVAQTAIATPPAPPPFKPSRVAARPQRIDPMRPRQRDVEAAADAAFALPPRPRASYEDDDGPPYELLP